MNTESLLAKLNERYTLSLSCLPKEIETLCREYVSRIIYNIDFYNEQEDHSLNLSGHITASSLYGVLKAIKEDQKWSLSESQMNMVLLFCFLYDNEFWLESDKGAIKVTPVILNSTRRPPIDTRIKVECTVSLPWLLEELLYTTLPDIFDEGEMLQCMSHAVIHVFALMKQSRLLKSWDHFATTGRFKSPLYF